MFTELGPFARAAIAEADQLASSTIDFLSPKGPGVGDRFTADFLKRLGDCLVTRNIAAEPQFRVGQTVAYSFDFYIPAERTVIEIALGAHNPSTEYEKDILKCLIARTNGIRVDHLVLLGRPGAKKRLSGPGPSSIARHALMHWNLLVDVLEIPGAVEELTVG
jgi:hypothetical protein